MEIIVEKVETWIITSGQMAGQKIEGAKNEAHLKRLIKSKKFYDLMKSDLARQRVTQGEIEEFRRNFIRLGGLAGIEHFMKMAKKTKIEVVEDESKP